MLDHEIIRHRFPKQRDFVRFVLRQEWQDIHRVQMGRLAPCKIQQLAAWCGETCGARWSRSDAGEVFYFEDITDATHFRLRWSEPLTNDN